MPEPDKYKGHVEGSVLRSIFRMGLPSMIGFGAANVYDIVDMFWLARLGVDPPAAITFFFAFFWVIFSVNMIAGTGSVSIISQNFGSGNIDATEVSIKETFVLKAILAVGFGAIGLLILEPVLTLLGAEGSVLQMALEYGRIQLYAMVFPFCAFTVYTALRGIGNPKWAMTLMLTSIALNMILDPVLIFGWWIFPELGVAGAAWASIIGYAFSVIAGLALFYGGVFNVKLHLIGKIRLGINTMLKIMRIGAPSGINAVSFSLSRSVIMWFVGYYGTEVVAAYGVGNRISAFGIMVVVGLGLGISALIGQTLGAENPERAWKTSKQSIWLSTVVMTSFGAVCFFGADLLMRLFFDSSAGGQSAQVHHAGVVFLRIIAFSFPFVGIFITIEQVFCGAGKNLPPMLFGIAANWLLEIPLIWGLAWMAGMNETGVWLAVTAAHVIATAAFIIYYHKKTWLHYRVKTTTPF